MESQKIRKRVSWKKIIGWGFAGILILIVAAITTGYLLLEHNQGFRQMILTKVEGSVAESTGARLEVRDFHVHLSDLSLDLYGIKIHGSETNPDEPLLQADHVNVGLK